MITAIEKGILSAGSIGALWGIMYVEQDPKAGFCVAMTCLVAMIAVIFLDMKMPRRSWHSRHGKGDSSTSSYHGRRRDARKN